MRRKLSAIAPYLLLICVLVAMAPAALAASPLELVLFHSPLCSSCQEFSATWLPPLQSGYGDRLVVREVDVSTAEGLAELELAEAAAGSFNNPLPVLLIDGVLLASQDLGELTGDLDAELETRLGAPSPAAAGSTPQVTETPPQTEEENALCLTNCVSTRPIHVVYISKVYCSVCDRTRLLLDVVGREYPQMTVHEFDQSQDATLLEAMGQQLGIPSERRLIAPSLYIGDESLVGEAEVTRDALRSILTQYAETGAPEFWTELDTSTATSSILSRFRGLNGVAVFLAGLIDGVNPCAFATILFFVSYLAISHRSRKEMLLVGGAFTLGVLITYFAVGAGAMQLLTLVEAARGVGLVLYSIMALACLVLGLLSARDYVLARRGKLSDMSLNLPDKLRERIHRRIRAGRGASVGAAALTG
ncbi:MAG: cytochrome c biogenesis protein, partial [Anaerolineae bacterium]